MRTTDRDYICENCDSIVKAHWLGPGSFAIGCACKTIPVVPQLGQDETPNCWHVKRPECCSGVAPKNLERIYESGKDYQCSDCEAQYLWDGTMVGAPNTG